MRVWGYVSININKCTVNIVYVANYMSVDMQTGLIPWASHGYEPDSMWDAHHTVPGAPGTEGADRTTTKRLAMIDCDLRSGYPLVMTNIAIENGYL